MNVGDPIPPSPTAFTPDGAPPGVAVRLDAYGSWPSTRAKIKPRVAIVHTNAAQREGSLQSSINWGNAAPDNTKPHYNVNAPQPTKTLASNLRAIANSTGDTLQGAWNEQDCSFWTIAIESADMGTIAAAGAGYPSGDLGPFLYDHDEIVARILAYESIVWDFPLDVPAQWNAAGVVTHTFPWPYPYYTTVRGKTCPGGTKKHQVFNLILPRAREIRNAWLNPPEDDMKPVIIIDGYADQFELVAIGNPEQRRKRGIPDSQQPIVATLNAAELQAQIPYKLTPAGS